MQILRVLLTILDTSTDPRSLAVACFDISQFIQYHPAGRVIVTDLKAKERVMKLMNHENAEVTKNALLCIQRLLLGAKYASFLQAWWDSCMFLSIYNGKQPKHRHSVSFSPCGFVVKTCPKPLLHHKTISLLFCPKESAIIHLNNSCVVFLPFVFIYSIKRPRGMLLLQTAISGLFVVRLMWMFQCNANEIIWLHSLLMFYNIVSVLTLLSISFRITHTNIHIRL